MIFPEIKIYNPDSFQDFRGELYTLFKQEDSSIVFNHDKVSISRKNVLRGLHGDNKSWKLVTCLAGEIYLVIVDNRPDSLNYLKWDWVVLTSKNRCSVLIPPMFANGHYILSQEATFFYKWSYPGEYPDVNDQFTLKWNDPNLGIHWPTFNPILSKRDL
jgi:dTDP-4-dehydrorhamnose 3,5-epimerase|tara:strand:- start:603 stop:1079 length:477 start_codon:yes stop_codon:yes gene_type:complete